MSAFVLRTLVLTLLAVPAAAQSDFAACAGGLAALARARGVAQGVIDRVTAGLVPDPSVLEAAANQPEFKTPIWDYLAALVDDERIADGRARLAQNADALAAAESRFGVDRHTIVAVWGVESDYGKSRGERSLVRSLATLACAGDRRRYFAEEWVATLRIIDAGDIKPELLVGSWAGAFGQTQFMPSTFLRLAVDLDGDGRRDIIDSVPDALGSTANYLARAGWVSGASWGYEVRVPAGYRGESGRRTKRPLAAFAEAGIRRVDGSPLTGPQTGPSEAALLQPAGSAGPAFIVFRNFDAIFSYNRAESYALAIAHLADRLRGGGAFAAAWPTDDRGLSRAERREVQERLAKLGYEVGAIDGRIGARTRAAIKAFAEKTGLAQTAQTAQSADGRAGGKVLEALRRSTGSTQ